MKNDVDGESEMNYYFFEIKKGKALEQLLQDTGSVCHDSSNIFKFWAKELLYALNHLMYRCTYSVKGNITLRNVYVADSGIKLFLKKIKFGELRENSKKF